MTTNKNNKDLNLKLMCKILFKEMGYNTYYEVRLRTRSYIESLKVHDISDIDVLGVFFLADMTPHLIGAECKSGASNALEELYKFIGVMRYFEFNKGYLIKSKIHQNARQVALDKNISCFSESELRMLLAGFDIDIDRQIKIENAKYYKLKESIIAESKENSSLVSYILFEFWNKDNWRNIHNIIYFLSTPKQKILFKDIYPIRKLFYYFILELFALSMLKNVSQAIAQNYSDVESALFNFLYGGPDSVDEKIKVYDLINQYSKTNKTFSPEWERDFINLSVRFANHSVDCSHVINMIQNIRENSFFKEEIVINKQQLTRYSDLTRKYLQDIMHFLLKYTLIDESIFKDFMAL